MRSMSARSTQCFSRTCTSSFSAVCRATCRKHLSGRKCYPPRLGSTLLNLRALATRAQQGSSPRHPGLEGDLYRVNGGHRLSSLAHTKITEVATRFLRVSDRSPSHQDSHLAKTLSIRHRAVPTKTMGVQSHSSEPARRLCATFTTT